MLQQPTLAAILLLTLFSLANSMEVRHRLMDLLSLAERNQKKQVVEGPNLFYPIEKGGGSKATATATLPLTTTTSIIVDEETYGATTVGVAVAALAMVGVAVIAALFAVVTATFFVRQVAKASEK